MRKHVLLALLALVVVMLAGTASTAAAAYTTNTECLGCHSVPVSQDTTGVVFSAAPVSLASCSRCHAGLTSTTMPEVLHHKHFAGTCTAVNCHPGWASVYAPTYPSPSANTAYGWFQSTASTRTPAAQLHKIHDGSTWVMGSTFSRNTCKRCHGAVACSRCHGGDSTVSHSRHAVSEYPTVTVMMSTGTTYTAIKTTCVNPSCHSLAKAGTTEFTPFCGDCHTTNINEHGGDHSFSSASDYVASSQSGCTNSGQGCHGTDGDYSDIRNYGHTGCQDGLCHMSADKPNVDPPLDCLKCHGATYANAPLVGDLPTQHYSATLHRTELLYMTDTWISAGGFAKATCNYCHYADLAAEHAFVGSGSSGSGLDCAECHNNVSSNGLAEVSSDWAARRCESCHSPFSATPFHGTSAPVAEGVSSGCGASGIGCHESNDLHALHKDEGSCQDGCHGPDLLPTKRSCGADDSDCHISKVDSHYSATRHTASGDIAGTETLACSTCHTALLPSAHKATSAATCSGCHNNPLAAAVITASAPWDKNCSACHPTRHGEIETDHQGDPTGANSCVGGQCHDNNTTDLRMVHSSLANGCELAGCHAAANVDEKPTGKTCGDGGACHDGFADGNHGEHVFTSASDYSTTTASGCTNSGAGCHGSDSAYVISAYHEGCGESACHTSESKATFSETFECVNCHDGTFTGAANAVGEAHYNAVLHTATGDISGTETLSCTECHSASLSPAHSNTGARTCYQCHNSGTGIAVLTSVTGWDKNCFACHSVRHAEKDTTAHTGVTPADTNCMGSRCHEYDSIDLRVVHTKSGCKVTGCHDTLDSAPTEKECKACHPGMADGSHCSGPVAEPYNGCDGAGCHSVAADIHDVPQHPKLCGSCHWLQYDQACICHNKAGVHAGTTHGNTDCMTCHISGTSMPHGMITLKPLSVGCGSCHGSTHNSGSDCTRCHTSNVHDEDSAHVTNSACDNCHNVPAGTTALNCTTCHPGGASAQNIGDETPYAHCRDCHGSTHHTNDDCRECHSATRIHGESDHSDRGCAKCHGAPDSIGGDGGTQPGLVPDPYAGCTGTSCHSVYADVHRLAGHPKECKDCHNVAPGQACSCHTKAQIHPVYNHTRTDCTTCHQNGLPKPHVTVTSKLGVVESNWVYVCNRCHTKNHQKQCWNCHSPRGAATGTPDNYYDSWGSNDWSNGGVDVHNVSGHMTNSRCGYCHAIASVDMSLNCTTCHPGGRPAALTFVTETTGTIAGHITDASGTGIANVNVNVGAVTIQSDMNGYYRIINLTPGVKTVTVSKIGYVTQTKSIDVVVGMANICDFQLLPALGGVAGTVKDAAGNPISDVTVAVAGDGYTKTDANGHYELPGLPNGAYTLTYSLATYTSQTTSVTVNGSVMTRDITLLQPSLNLALNRMASASSQYSSTYGAAKAFDGTTSSYWRPQSTGTQWLKVDLGSAKSISKVSILWSGYYYAKAYRVETSIDGVNWVTKYSTGSAGSGVKTHTFAATNARYVRLYCTSAYSSSYRVNEFQVWNY